MKKIKRYIIAFSMLTMIILSFNAIAVPAIRKHSQQLLLVLTKNWNAVTGSMQRYQRDSNRSTWMAVGKPVHVVVGKNGLAWGVKSSVSAVGPIKKEGDLRTPAGIFAIHSTFGFAAQTGKHMHIPYLALTQTNVCVDDARSTYYNQIINTAAIVKPDWNSSEQMKQVPLYKWGMLIEYNTNKPIPYAGSCIFMHIWRNPQAGTAGCVAMSEPDLKQVLYWLNSRKQPSIVMLTEDILNQYGKNWGLPTTTH